MTTQAYDSTTYRSGTRGGASVFSSNMPHRAPLLCYIAGIECPITDATVSYGVWRIPEATITMFPDPQMQRFGAEDRVPVVLFFLDEYTDYAVPTWRLLFEGEIVSWSYVNAVGGRALSFTCVMNIAMWTQLFIFYMTSLSSVVSAFISTKEDPASIAEGRAISGLLMRQGLLQLDKKAAKGEDAPPLSADDFVTRPYDIAYNVVRALISDKIEEKQRCVPGVNFFARWARREQFHNRWVALPFLEEPTTEDGKVVNVPGIFPILRAAQSLEAVQAVENHVADKYSGGSIYTILKQVLDTVMMELVMLPTAPCVGTHLNGVINGEPVFRTTQQQVNMDVKTALTDARTVLVHARNTGTVDETTLMQAFQVAGLPYDYGGINSALLEDAIGRIDKKTASSLDTGPKDALLPTRLANYFVKPQMLFGLPPNCNVIFPSMTPQISYQESYVTQPTRLYFQDDSMMQFAGFAQASVDSKKTVLSAISRAYPPSVDAKWKAHLEANGADSGRNLLVWPEEYFKGPVTARYPAPAWLMFLAAEYSRAGKQPGTDAGKPTEKSTKADSTSANDRDGGSLTDQDVYALYAQYEYFRHRFAQRQGAVTLAFQPFLVPGLPLAVFDDFQSQMHLVGYLMNVTQQFTSRSVVTSCNFSYGRTLPEFFDLLANELDTGGIIAERKNLAMAAAPAEPIKEIRDVTQHFHKAEQFYQTLLHRRTTARAVFEYRDLIAFVDGKGELEDIQIEGVNEATLAKQREEATAAKALLQPLMDSNYSAAGVQQMFIKGTLDPGVSEQIRTALDIANGGLLNLGDYAAIVGNRTRLEEQVSHLDRIISEPPQIKHNLGRALEREIRPKPGAEPYFDSYDAAMQYCARPICTLEEYIEFIRGIREGINDELAYDSDGSATPSARYYTRIRDLKGVPANFQGPTKAQQGLEGTPQALHPKTDSEFPVLRAEWQKVLLSYRAKVYTAANIQR